MADEAAFAAFARNDGRFAGFPAGKSGGLYVEPEARFLFLLAVAFVAAFGENRLNLPGKINGSRRWLSWRSRSGRSNCQREKRIDCDWSNHGPVRHFRAIDDKGRGFLEAKVARAGLEEWMIGLMGVARS